ncbi:MAG TPA: substrate-binding domain-containing protein [Bacteroidales bacterium]|nr:substrate-binding domain-containing protein [Bacteroidales bacterium]HPS17461.1 substrate-binding domain-containing protein [Bacteroidales bacterium]
MKTYLKYSPVLIIILFLTSCSGFNKKNNTINETPTSGNIKIAVDEAYQLLYDTEIYTFESIYANAKINASYKPEGEAFADFMNDSARIVITNRKLTDTEEKVLMSKQIYPKTVKIAIDALAFIINNDNPDTLLQYEQIADIFSGKINKWNQINPKSLLTELNVVFDNTKSCNTRFIKEKFNLKNDFPKNCFAVNTNSDVISYVEKNKNAIGIISVNWISDKDDSISHEFLKKIKVISVSTPGSIDDYYKPYPGNIAEGSYPLTRDVYMINRETFTGLGTGFVSFVAGEKGQRIALKSGLVPATMPVRLITIKSE